MISKYFLCILLLLLYTTILSWDLFLNSNNFESEHRSNILFLSIKSVFDKFIPVNLELNEKLFELIKDDLGINKEIIQKKLENLKTNQVSEGGYRKRKTRYQKRLIKRNNANKNKEEKEE